ncbi:uncharacterized protein LOC125211753 isoform X2 [Salvia hispanica]|nr:uncharacterized protein LOC125211753 isoform X2 [Salvia hispanica]
MFPLSSNDNDDLEASEDLSLDADSFTADQCRSKDDNFGKMFISREKLDSCLENAVETNEACFGGTGKAESDSLYDFLGDRKLPIETYSSLPNQVLDQEALAGCAASSSDEAGGMGNDVRGSCLAYNSRIENETIIFNFSSPDGLIVGNSMAEDVEERSTKLGDVNAENLPAVMETSIQCTSDLPQQSLLSNEWNSDSGSTTNEGSPNNIQANSDDGLGQSPSNKSPAATNEAHASEANNDKRESGDIPVANQLQQDMGETSFSAASMITYSGPIAYSGSVSHRSDGSTTSGKSFAFPVLQSEWNSSPVRMAKADVRGFRKHKGWRSGLLCCRF